MDIDAIRDTLLQSMEDQYNADVAANEEAQKIAQQKIMYANDARGSLYSGQPTWDRAQTLAEGASNLSSIQNNYLKNKLNVWDNITNTLDQINSYNKAAAALNKATSNASAQNEASFWEIYNSLIGGEE